MGVNEWLARWTERNHAARAETLSRNRRLSHAFATGSDLFEAAEFPTIELGGSGDENSGSTGEAGDSIAGFDITAYPRGSSTGTETDSRRG